MLDTLAAITAGFRQEGVDIVRDYAIERHAESDASRGATLLDGTGTALTVAGATLANATAANALDVDDGHREVKGHPAAVVIPAAMATAEVADATIRDFLDAVYIGYELAVRAGLAIHELDGVYTGTGSWGALGAAAAAARLNGLSEEQTAHALGVAEYHAPRTPIMRGVERPGMTKDGIGWGSYAGVVAADLAASGFTGSGTNFDDINDRHSLDGPFHVTRGYLKPHPCCRWAQPGVEAVLGLVSQNELDPGSVERIRVATFEEVTYLQTCAPTSPEDAQYSYPYPVTAALVRGQFTQAEHAAEGQSDPEVLDTAERVELLVDEALDAAFPHECLARVEIETTEATYESGVTKARGARDDPLSDAARLEKARRLVSPTLPMTVIDRLEMRLDDGRRSVASLTNSWRS